MTSPAQPVIDYLHKILLDPEFARAEKLKYMLRTDDWKWYCRICGAEGQDPSRMVRNIQSRQHLSDSPVCGRGSRLGEAESGRLLHIWTYNESVHG